MPSAHLSPDRRGTGTIEEIVAILRNEGLIDEATQQKLLVKHASEREKKHTNGVLEGLEWSGDLRVRHEAFWFDGDATGAREPDNRYRLRYRARIGFEKQLSDRVRVGLRLASGVGSNRGTNVSFGEQPDFGPEDIFIDRAWVELRLGDGPVDTRLRLGKVSNPFRWRVDLDRLMWDPDITPEGGTLQVQKSFGERGELWGTFGAFIAEENSGVVGSKSDPKVFVLQLGATRRLTDALELGGRVSAYEWRSLDRTFIERAKTLGNLDSAFDGKARIGELSAYGRFMASEACPVLLHGSLERNFTADSAPIGGGLGDAEDIAWAAGFEVGDARKNAKFGFTFLSCGGERDRRQLCGQRPPRRSGEPRGFRRLRLAQAQPTRGAAPDLLRVQGDPQLKCLRRIASPAQSAASSRPAPPAVVLAREFLRYQR